MDMPTFEHDDIVEIKGVQFRVKLVQTVRGETSWKIQIQLEAIGGDKPKSVIDHMMGNFEKENDNG